MAKPSVSRESLQKVEKVQFRLISLSKKMPIFGQILVSVKFRKL